MAGNNPTGKSGPRDKPFRDALRMELAAAGEDHKKLREIARNMIALACMNESSALPAIKEIADRTDGKVPQAVVGDDEHPPVGGEQQVSDLDAGRALSFILRKALNAPKDE